MKKLINNTNSFEVTFESQEVELYFQKLKKYWNSIKLLDLSDFDICPTINIEGYQSLVDKIFSEEEKNLFFIDFSYLKLFIIGETLPFGGIREYITITLLYNLDGNSKLNDYDSISKYFECDIDFVKKMENSMFTILKLGKYKYTLPKTNHESVYYHHSPNLSELYPIQSIGLRKLIYLEMISKYSFVNFSIVEFITWSNQDCYSFFEKLNKKIDRNAEFAYIPKVSYDELTDAKKILNSLK